MWLINTESLELEEFSGQANLPQYAILSHTWGKAEVSYEDFRDPAKRQQLDTSKLDLTCEQARKDGLKYVWIDTCCINKASSAELSEAINSMFNWYRRSTKCYAFLKDCDNIASMAKSKWFTRGWTLQELISSNNMDFYGAEWNKLGSKVDLLPKLHRITGIDEEILGGKKELSSVSVAERMSWAAGRETRREEDIAYSLMGLFDVNMPMLYGEGRKAFIRLQEEILKQSEDQSLFAWRATPESAAVAPYRGIFADSPDEFVKCDGIAPFQTLSASQTPMIMTNRGVPLTSTVKWIHKENQVIAQVGLNCRWGKGIDSVAGIELVSQGGDQYVRSSPAKLLLCSSYGLQETVYVAKAMHATALATIPSLDRQHAFHISELPRGALLKKVYPKEVSYSAKQPLIEVGSWKADKVALEFKLLGLSGVFVLLLWANRDRETTAYNYSFDAKLIPQSLVDETIQQAKRPRNNVEKKVIPSQQSSLTLVVTGKPGKVQGFDMFCIEVGISEEPRPRLDQRPRSMYSAMNI
ncbi:HET-domain-containing protein [Nemania sp. FL0031]|nr:HET-domain-containing protein [Nemania sp. FL0031]